VQSERLDRAIGEMLAIGVKRREAANVDVPQVDRRSPPTIHSATSRPAPPELAIPPS
jgi:hypothetical protein